MASTQTVATTRFGDLDYSADELWLFPRGLIGLEHCHQWLLLGEEEDSPLVWLQSVDEPDLAMPLISPRRYVPKYRVQLRRAEMAPLQLADDDLLFVLTTVSVHGGAYTTDLRAPLLFNATRRRGLQVVAQSDLPLHYVLPARQGWLRRSA